MKDRIIFLLELLFLISYFTLKNKYLNDYDSGIFLKSGTFIFLGIYAFSGIQSRRIKFIMLAFHFLMAFIFAWHILNINWIFYNHHVIFCILAFGGLTLALDLFFYTKKAFK